MLKLNSSQIRQKFLYFFAKHQHQVVPSSSLVPHNDPTLLFTNAGMIQFKDVFLGVEKRAYKRATTVQRCVRAGGKHNDLENVGFTVRHHTFFEMLGNFSFGDYFKREAIQYAWEFLIQELKLPKEKLWITVYEKDKEAEDIWLKEMKVDPKRFSRCGEKDNFWAMGDTGPCGPCTEIFYDHGPEIAGGPPGSPEADGDRYIEIWNLVFMQYERQANGELKPLPKPSVDTGMGFERIAAVIQGVHSNYEIDLFQHLIFATAKITKTDDLTHNSLKVIADHIRSCSFLIADGVMPSNEGRGYVLRRIIRRAIRHGNKLGVEGIFFYRLVQPLVEQMGEAYPELVVKQTRIESALRKEEEQFAQTLDNGLRILQEDIAQLKGNIISGETLFKLHDTYGFPIDLTADIAREMNLSIDEAEFERCMQEQRDRSQQESQFEVDYTKALKLNGETKFTGYEHLKNDGKIIALLLDNQQVNTLSAGQTGAVVLDQTPFYAESGGQVGDKGELVLTDGSLFLVQDTKKVGSIYLHLGRVKSGQLKINEQVSAMVNGVLRQATKLNHSATHLLHAALHQVLGEHVVQKGSLVEPTRLRFDFSHFEPVTKEQLQVIEQMVNTEIRKNHLVAIDLTSLEVAKAAGVVALFGEKYGEVVRVLKMGDFSQELCGGTHVIHTGDIGLFKIVNEVGTAAGIRRIEAITGETAIRYVENMEKELGGIASLLKTKPESLMSKIEALQQQVRTLEKQNERLQAQLASGAGGRDLVQEAQDIAGIKVIAAKLEGIEINGLRHALDQLKDKLNKAVIVLASIEKNNKVQIVAGVTKNLAEVIKAGEVVNFVALQVGGKGGGRADMAQAGGNDPGQLEAALASVYGWVKDKVSS
ncbi:MAG: alanine--tRNA ligase [Gammaproteobacteria bacterium RIFCSPHIGHO2_12_FULL_35_23]|nr:MAG: alanine--tRNA ligase [Gammaproteobacteria bacterium RIFCSPHIGHO2_12_FULL_35_23]